MYINTIYSYIVIDIYVYIYIYIYTQVLQVPRDATQKQITKAYRKLALKYHPDHNKSDHATKEFQTLSKIHSTLSDERRRRIYDSTGEEPEEDSAEFDSAYEHWRSVFPEFTFNDIDASSKNNNSRLLFFFM